MEDDSFTKGLVEGLQIALKPKNLIPIIAMSTVVSLTIVYLGTITKKSEEKTVT